MPLRDKLRNLAGFVGFRVDGQCLSEREMATLRDAAETPPASASAWHTLSYPGEWTLPIFLTPITHPTSERLTEALQTLRAEMQKEGFGKVATRTHDTVEHLRAHLWVAKLARGQYLPIGVAVFALEERTHLQDAAPPTPGTGNGLRLQQEPEKVISRRWWLRHVWLKPAYRCQHILRHSVPYFAAWHPEFRIRDPWPALARALAGHPTHIADGTLHNA